MLWQTINFPELIVTVEAVGVAGLRRHKRHFGAAFAPLQIAADPAQSQLSGVSVAARMDAHKIAPVDRLSNRDRRLILRNLHGPDVLDSEQWPEITFRGIYGGTPQAGALRGDVTLCGRHHELELSVTGELDGGWATYTARWEGPLRQLGIQPFRAPLGIAKLRDWLALEIHIELEPCDDPR